MILHLPYTGSGRTHPPAPLGYASVRGIAASGNETDTSDTNYHYIALKNQHQTTDQTPSKTESGLKGVSEERDGIIWQLTSFYI